MTKREIGRRRTETNGRDREIEGEVKRKWSEGRKTGELNNGKRERQEAQGHWKRLSHSAPTNRQKVLEQDFHQAAISFPRPIKLTVPFQRMRKKEKEEGKEGELDEEKKENTRSLIIPPSHATQHSMLHQQMWETKREVKRK